VEGLWSTCGAATLPGAKANNSSLKMPLARTSPKPLSLVSKSAWYQETPGGLLGCWANKIGRLYPVSSSSRSDQVQRRKSLV
jgi:hypothetical protein